MPLEPLDSGESFLNNSQELGSGSPVTLAISCPYATHIP